MYMNDTSINSDQGVKKNFISTNVAKSRDILEIPNMVLEDPKNFKIKSKYNNHN